MSTNLETRSLLDDWRNFDKGCFFDLGHPLLNRIAESFVKAAGIGAIQAAARESCFIAVEGTESSNSPDITGSKNKKNRFPDLRGETNRKSLEAMVPAIPEDILLIYFFCFIQVIFNNILQVKSTGKESLQWGLAAGLYSGLTYGLKEARGAHDWKNSAMAGAITGMALALTSEEASHEQVVQCAITGAAISTAANLLTGIF
ncbi:Mitochondrial import inner membrane translocase subunit Tim17/Tim22/Tim23 family protein isoform 2 [Theobroma cacao]|uniref:Mitochondrial import inner membrane translocase subunit Tim17/Tim22/Tim23 family protein isoform 2 n=1 Tax=Theobroma cacao TaxID=3641 RepID=A0A061EWS8_THECC|nr:Mitochondrial import inner membrane translocase subunit Tim17/Tim22/Tim23 family protein isoform 2 [Theobroma cacao]